MILGTGNDLIDIRRIEQLLKRFGNHFENRFFTPAEQEKARSRSKAGTQTIAATYAKRFAAKEACSKALGTGFRNGVSWRDIEITNLSWSAPSITLNGQALTQLNQLTPKGLTSRIHLSLTDEYPYALAHILIEAIPNPVDA